MRLGRGAALDVGHAILDDVRAKGAEMAEDLKQLIAKAAEALRAAGAKEVYLFGSAATGKMKRTSDVDILVDVGDISLYDFVSIKLELEDALGRSVDLAVAGLPPERFFPAMARAARILDRSLDLVDLDEDNPFTHYLREEGELIRVG